MNGLGSTLAALKRSRANTGAGAAEIMTEISLFGDNPGELRMLSFVPKGMKPRAPLVVVLHGCTQTAEAHANAAGWLTLAARGGFAVLAPEQRTSNNPNRCFNWFEVGDADRDRGEAASIRAMIAHMIETHGLDADRVFITGLSAGGAMTSAMLAAYPEVFAGGAIVAGLPYGAATSVRSAFQAMRGTSPFAGESREALKSNHVNGRLPRVAVWHGDADRTVNVTNADRIAQQWVKAHALAPDASETRILEGREQKIWRGPSGDVLVETNIVRGLGHGTPLSTLGESGLGREAPYMLEAEISAVLEIARFWDLPVPKQVRQPAAKLHFKRARQQAASPIGASIMASLQGRVSKDIERTIAGALQRAGLMH